MTFIEYGENKWYITWNKLIELKGKGLIWHCPICSKYDGQGVAIEIVYHPSNGLTEELTEVIVKHLTIKKKQRVYIDGIWYRLRRGKLVSIPEEWVGKVPHDIMERASKQGGKRYRKNNKHKKDKRD